MTETNVEDGLGYSMETAEKQKKTSHAGTAVLTGPMVTLRPIGAGDIPILRAWDGDPEIIALMGRRFDNQTPEDWFRNSQKGRESRAWMIESDGQPVGELELAQINWRSGTAEIRICIGERAYWGKGLGTEALIHLLNHAFAGMNLKSIYLRVFATNLRALRLYQRLGFRKEAVLSPSSRRQDPAPVILMSLTSSRWASRQRVTAG